MTITALRFLSLILLCCMVCVSRDAVSAQKVDWRKLFDQDNSGNQAVVDANRQELLGRILPMVCEEEAALAAAEIPDLVLELNRPQDRVRLDASGILVTIAISRRDSAMVLAQALPALQKKVYDPVDRIRHNVVRAITSLQPAIPDEQLRFLIQLISSPDEKVAAEAAYGIAAISAKQLNAANAVSHILATSDSPSLLVAVIKGISASRAANPEIVEHLGGALFNKDERVVMESLKCIERLGSSAIQPNRSKIKLMSTKSEISLEIRTLAQQILDREP